VDVSDNKRQKTEMTRRAMLEKLLAAAAAGAVWPVLASALDWKPLVLSPQQNETLVALSESMIPGSAKAQVNRFIDLLLSVDTAENGNQFVASLTDVERASESKFNRALHQLTSNERDEMLTSLSTDKAHQKNFGDLKEWITTAYYSSEDGMRELGWTGEHAFRQYPVCS
jgi:hypothetical protein